MDHRRLGVFIATGVVTAGLAAFPAFTFADGNGDGNGNGNGNAHQNSNGHGNGNGHGSGNDQGDDNDAGVDHVVVCHLPPGNPGNAHTITVGAPAVAAHLRNHGDRLGPCETTTTPEEPTTSTGTSTSTSTSTTATTVALQPTVTVSYTPTSDAEFCSVVIGLTHFGSSQSYDVTLVHSSPYLTNTDSPWTFSNVPTDAAGAAHFVAFIFFQGLPEDASFTASANGISSDTVNVSC
jgi:hypothetical protein